MEEVRPPAGLLNPKPTMLMFGLGCAALLADAFQLVREMRERERERERWCRDRHRLPGNFSYTHTHTHTHTVTHFQKVRVMFSGFKSVSSTKSSKV
jgi:hypothetical protein